MKTGSSGWKLKVLLLLAFALFSFLSLYAVVWQRNRPISPKATTVVCTILEENEPVENENITVEMLTANGTRIAINGILGSNGSIGAETPLPLDAPLLLKRVALSGKWIIQTVRGDRTYHLSERVWNLTDPQDFLNGYSNYTFKEVYLQGSQIEGRLHYSLELYVSPARLIVVYNPLSQLGEVSLFVQGSPWEIGEYVNVELEDVNFVLVDDSVLVAVPLGQPLRLTMLAKVFDFSWLLRIDVDVGNRDFVDLSAPIVRAVSKAQVQELSGTLDILAVNGFDVREQYEKVSKVRSDYEKAALAMELGDYAKGLELMQTAWGPYTEVFFHIREIYANTLPWTISVALILAFLSVTVAHLLSENKRMRNLLTSSIFLFFLSVFAYAQPSMRLFALARMGVAEKLDIYLLISLVQMLPWIIVAIELAAYPRFRDLLWETFGVTMRNMRRRRLRTLLTLTTIIVVSGSAMCLLSITPHVPIDRIPLSGLEPTVPNGLTVSRYEVLTPKPSGGYKAAKGDSHPLTIQTREATWMMSQPSVAQANVYGLKQVKISNSTGQSLSDFSIFHLAVVNFSFVKGHCTLGSSEDAWLEEYEENAVSVGSKIANAYGIRVGDEILIDDRSFKVKGVFDENQIVNEWKEIDGDNFFFGIHDPSAGTISEESFLLGSIDDFQLDAFSIYRVSLILDDVKGLDDFAGDLLERGYYHEATLLYDITRTYFLHMVRSGAVTSVYYGQSRLALVGPWYGQMVVIALSAMMIFINVFASINERKTDILAMYVVGASPIRIRLVFVAEALATGLMGGIYGYVMGYTFAKAANLVSPAAVQLDLSGSTPFVISILTSVLSSVLGSISPSKKAILMVVPSRRMLRTSADVFSMNGKRAFIEVPMRISQNELDSFEGFLRNLAERFPPVRYAYDGLSVLSLEKEETEGELSYAIEINYAVERSLYYKVGVLLQKDERPQKIQILIYPLDPWERKVTKWSSEHAGLLPRLAACLRNEILKYAEWKREPYGL